MIIDSATLDSSHADKLLTGIISDTCMRRLDAHRDGWSPIDTKNWSASGCVMQSVRETL